MKAEIKSIASPDVEDLEHYIPFLKDEFFLGIEVIIGPKSISGGEIFQFSLCTPKYLSKELTHGEILFGKGYIFVSEYNYKLLYERLNKYLDNLVEDSWELLAAKINRVFLWEFEDYNG